MDPRQLTAPMASTAHVEGARRSILSAPGPSIGLLPGLLLLMTDNSAGGRGRARLLANACPESRLCENAMASIIK